MPFQFTHPAPLTQRPGCECALPSSQQITSSRTIASTKPLRQRPGLLGGETKAATQSLVLRGNARKQTPVTPQRMNGLNARATSQSDGRMIQLHRQTFFDGSCDGTHDPSHRGLPSWW
ncbi:uncharacterized protein CIMG_01834 [Coccidioides immitis RS]|uniref:Uncharacterized protein n=3 Tax=Coccidioides immitis TaxID=5501 RepID=J3KK15_COCIM|nr:uncharacterized protein CIMG_01834 [Coccidioides immitis RS]EAS36480.3 hypothetical protein CIMG_01834 [Coccidioides immitis RS]KMP01839.1 hypothetical protein CIRG_01979 [Coccidioides immitis RMSCC 2394]KMU90250.1 hypothetical protein CIHG_08061 [Coccidioides immitis H538.4]